MSVFADGVIIQRRFNDFDALAEAIPGWKLEAVSVAGGAFEAQLDMAMTAEMQLTRLKLNGGLLITGMSPEGAAGAGPVALDGQDGAAPRIIHVHRHRNRATRSP